MIEFNNNDGKGRSINEIIKSLDFTNKKISPFTTEQIFNAFKQGTVKLPLLWRIGGGGNCASVALIKAAIATFGFDNIFKSIIIDEINNRYLIDLKNDDKTVYSLSFSDYEFAAEKSAFELYTKDSTSKDILEFAKFCFAVMAEIKRLDYRYNNKYSRGVNDLNKGESAEYIYEYLGLEIVKVENISIEYLSVQKNIILWNAPHAVFSSEGNYDEFFELLDGKKLEGIQPISKLQVIHGDGTNNNKPIGAYFFKND